MQGFVLGTLVKPQTLRMLLVRPTSGGEEKFPYQLFQTFGPCISAFQLQKEENYFETLE